MNDVIPGRASTTPTSSSALDPSDTEFLVAFESCRLGADAFRHYEHVRLAWIYLRGASPDDAAELMGASIRRFALHHTGSTSKYSEALTRAWMRLVAHAITLAPGDADFATFAAAHPMLFDRRRAFEYYGVTAP